MQVAIKIIETDKIKEEYVKKNLLREAQLMRRLRHPNIIRLYETMKTNTLYCLVTEVAEGGELLSHVRNDCKEKKLPEASARMFVRQLISALDYLHSAGIVHRWVECKLVVYCLLERGVELSLPAYQYFRTTCKCMGPENSQYTDHVYSSCVDVHSCVCWSAPS